MYGTEYQSRMKYEELFPELVVRINSEGDYRTSRAIVAILSRMPRDDYLDGSRGRQPKEEGP